MIFPTDHPADVPPEDRDVYPPARCDDGQHDYHFAGYCGAYVCDLCEDHRGLARCYCGWTLSGGDGREELEELGETIDPDY